MGERKAVYCRSIFTGTAPNLIDGYVVIDGNRISQVVSSSEWEDLPVSERPEKVLDFSDGFLMPAFFDYHVHMALAAMMEYFGTLRTAASEEEAAKILYEKNKDKDTDRWILGGAWVQSRFGRDAYPTKASLDRYFPNTPVFSMNNECHGAWLNSEGLRRLGITKDTPDPPHGKYFRDENGEPTGYAHELAIVPLLETISAGVSDAEVADFTKAFADMANRLGITSVADLPLHGLLRPEAYRIFQRKYETSLRIHFSTALFDSNDRIADLTEEFDGPVIRFNGVKDFVDGTPMGYTGYLLEPYADRPGFTSEPIIPRDRLYGRVTELDAMGIRVRLHCCGDGAVRLALDAFENAGVNNGFRDSRHAIEHIEVISPDDIDRFGKLGVVASVQPEHPPRTQFAAHPFHYLLDEKRIRYAWAFHSLEKAGAHLAFGTDYPVVEFTPFKGLFRVVNRLTNELEPEGGFIPQEKLTLEDSLRYYTWGSAYAAGRERDLGTLAPGMLADLIVLGKNPFDVISDRDAMFGMDVLLTIADGRIVHEG
jgi:predicted amidohydrolase YtcJ